MRRTFTATAALLLLVACASTDPRAEHIRVTSNPELVAGCEFLGEVRAGDWFWGATQRAERNADAKLRNAAAEMGATHVLLVTDQQTVGGASKRGEAYHCQDGTP